MDINDFKAKLENLEKQRLQALGQLNFIEGAVASIKALIEELEAAPAAETPKEPVKANIIPFHSKAPEIGSGPNDPDTRQGNVPQGA